MYALLNVVKAELVRYAKDWEGPTSWHMEYGVPVTVKKPDFFFSKKMPDEVQIVITRPEGIYPGLSDREARAQFRKDAEAEQGKMIAETKAKGRTFLGMGRVLRQSRHAAPSGNLERRGIRPHIAARSKWARIEALQGLRRFWGEHDAALKSFCAGEHRVEFPHGTYLMRVHFNVRVRPPP